MRLEHVRDARPAVVRGVRGVVRAGDERDAPREVAEFAPQEVPVPLGGHLGGRVRVGAHVPLQGRFEAVRGWYEAMDAEVPCYSCRVRRRAGTWQAVLASMHACKHAFTGADEGGGPRRDSHPPEKVDATRSARC